jgi:hypothetical protein
MHELLASEPIAVPLPSSRAVFLTGCCCVRSLLLQQPLHIWHFEDSAFEQHSRAFWLMDVQAGSLVVEVSCVSWCRFIPGTAYPLLCLSSVEALCPCSS